MEKKTFYFELLTSTKNVLAHLLENSKFFNQRDQVKPHFCE